MKPIIIIPTTDGKITLTKEEFEEYITKAYEAGKEDGETIINYPYNPPTPNTTPYTPYSPYTPPITPNDVPPYNPYNPIYCGVNGETTADNRVLNDIKSGKGLVNIPEPKTYK